LSEGAGMAGLSRFWPETSFRLVARLLFEA
jgi:hypothetical protein